VSAPRACAHARARIVLVQSARARKHLVMGSLSRRAVLAGAPLAASVAACAPTLTLPAAPPATPPAFVPARFERAGANARALLATHRAAIGAPSLSAAVGVGGTLLWSEAVGFADVAAETPASRDTRYRIGSTSKAVTATLTGKLVQEGVVAWDEPIATYKSDLPEKWRALTLRQLHSHTAGIPGYENNRDWIGLWTSWRRNKHYDDVSDALSEFDEAPLIYTPGAGFHYSSFDVVLASAVVQAAARQPFLELLHTRVLAPLNMNATAGDSETAAQRATFYDRAGAGQVRRSRLVDLSGRYASGGLIATSSDLVRLGASYLTHALLSADTVATMWTPQRLADGTVNEQSYALGWRSRREGQDTFGREVWRVHHGGVSMGAMSALVVYPDFGVTVAMNTNTEAESYAAFAAPVDALAKLFADAASA